MLPLVPISRRAQNIFLIVLPGSSLLSGGGHHARCSTSQVSKHVLSDSRTNSTLDMTDRTKKRQRDQEQTQRDEEKRQRVEQILEWISSERSGKRHAELQLKRKQDIGNWILETPEFVKWKTEDPCSVLLGRGIGVYSLQAAAI